MARSAGAAAAAGSLTSRGAASVKGTKRCISGLPCLGRFDFFTSCQANTIRSFELDMHDLTEGRRGLQQPAVLLQVCKPQQNAKSMCPAQILPAGHMLISN